MESDVLLVAIIVAVVAFVALVFIVKKAQLYHIETTTQESLSMKEVMAFFKNPLVFEELQKNKNLLAVVVREKKDNGDLCLILTCYDKDKEKIIQSPNTKAYRVKSIDSDLEQAFGEKDMIVLE